DSLQLQNKNTTHTQQPAGSAGASSLSPPYRDCFNFPCKLYIHASHSTTFTYIPHEITKSVVSDCSKLSQKHRKQKCSSGMEENRNKLPTQQTISDKNLRRRTRYAQMSPDKKQLFLSQLRAKRAESKRQKTLHQSNSTVALRITTSSLSPQQASKPTNVPSTSTTTEHIVTCLSTFKQGIEENRDNVPTQEQTSDRNLCRRTRYAQMSPERKKSFISQLIEKWAESKRQKHLHQSNSITALTITASSLSPQQCTSTRGEHMVGCLSSFELGSTSAACHVASKLPSTHSANKGFFPYFQRSAHHRSNRAIEERFCYWRNTTFRSSI
ncbi:hypothetical protein MTR67_025148, partial [Solanum verrucosum]